MKGLISMKNTLIIGFLLALFAFTSSVTAADAALKLGVVNVALLLDKAPQATQASANLEKEFAPQQSELKKSAKALEKKQADYQKNKMLLTDAQKTSREREITMMTREVQRKQNDIQELVNIRRNEELLKLQNLVNEAIKQVGKQQKFDLILYEGIAYTNNRLDVTQDVLSFLKKNHTQSRSGFNK